MRGPRAKPGCGLCRWRRRRRPSAGRALLLLTRLAARWRLQRHRYACSRQAQAAFDAGQGRADGGGGDRPFCQQAGRHGGWRPAAAADTPLLVGRLATLHL